MVNNTYIIKLTDLVQRSVEKKYIERAKKQRERARKVRCKSFLVILNEQTNSREFVPCYNVLIYNNLRTLILRLHSQSDRKCM